MHIFQDISTQRPAPALELPAMRTGFRNTAALARQCFSMAHWGVEDAELSGHIAVDQSGLWGAEEGTKARGQSILWIVEHP